VSAGESALLTKVLVPDSYLLSWNPWARSAMRKQFRDHPVDVFVTSSPPDSTHLLGLGLGPKRPAWIADFRDGWLFEPLRDPFPTAAQRALAAALERRVALRADAVVAVSRPMVDDFASRLGVRAELITNGWDPSLVSSMTDSAQAPDPRKFTLLHTGTVSGAWGRDPRPFLAALGQMADADPALAGSVEVLFAGMITAGDQDLLRDPRLTGIVRYIGFLDRSEIYSLQRAADALVLITSGNAGEATGKLFEYLGSGRPIIALAEGNEAARIVAETGTGVCVPPRDVNAIATELRRAIDGQLAQSYAPRGLERYSYPGTAQQMADLAARAVSARLLPDGMK
jgi:glycosyltransferase involved in cell wall biosynthesis